MKKLVVWYMGWGERWPLGTLADDREVLLFEYSPEALRVEAAVVANCRGLHR